MLSKDLENTLNLLFKECSDNNDEFVTIEHLLLVLTQEDSSRKVFDHLSIDIDSLQKEIKEYIKKNVPKATDNKEIQPTLAFNEYYKEQSFTFNQAERMKLMVKIYWLHFFQRKRVMQFICLAEEISLD